MLSLSSRKCLCLQILAGGQKQNKSANERNCDADGKCQNERMPQQQAAQGGACFVLGFPYVEVEAMNNRSPIMAKFFMKLIIWI